MSTVIDIYNFSDEEAYQYLQKNGVIDILKKGNANEISPKYDDIARLYLLVRKRKPFQILEFGSGFSTLVMAYALKQNWNDYVDLHIDSDNQFDKPHIFSIESSEKRQKNSLKKIQTVNLNDFSEIAFSKVSISEYQGQICHFYDTLPNIVPDFVYLDGPDPMTVSGSINGLSFQNPKRTVMSGDILKYESTLLPGFFMITDGRTNNARFLSRMLKREYRIEYHSNADVTTFELMEKRLGRKNIFGYEAYSGVPDILL